MKKIIIVLGIFCVIGLGYFGVRSYIQYKHDNIPGIAHGNGRLEATEIDIATRIAERIAVIKVKDGELVEKGQILVEMNTDSLKAQFAAAQAQIKVKLGELSAAKATLKQKESTLRNAKEEKERYEGLMKTQATTQQILDKARTNFYTAEAEVEAARASVQKAEAEVEAARADADKLAVDINDCELKAPAKGRIQYRIAEEGEVLSSGGRVLNLVDLTDVYMTFFLPEAEAGKVSIGAEARILLDAAPDTPIPASISYVSATAQFTPKTVETKIERQKLMFRIKARVAPELLNEYIQYVKTGLPGVAYVKLDPNAKWPKFLLTRAERGLPSIEKSSAPAKNGK